MKIIRLMLNAGAEIKGRARFHVDDKAYEIYKKAGSAKTAFIESLLLDAHNNNKYDFIFHSKRFNQTKTLSSPFDIYTDAEKNRNILIETMLLNAEDDSKYSVFLNNFNTEPAMKNESVPVVETIQEEEEDLVFPMLDDEEDKLSGW